MIKAVIFDIDGTLVDSVDLHAQAWKETFKEYGKDIPFQQVRHQIGKGGDQLMPVFFSREELDEFGEEMEEHRSELFKREFLPRVRSFPMVRELFERIRADDKRIALASSAKEDELAVYKKDRAHRRPRRRRDLSRRCREVKAAPGHLPGGVGRAGRHLC